MYFLNLHQVYSSLHSGHGLLTHRNLGKYSSNLKKTAPLEMTTKLACFLGWIEPAYLNQNYAVPLFLIIQANIRCLMPGIIGFYIQDDRGGQEQESRVYCHFFRQGRGGYPTLHIYAIPRNNLHRRAAATFGRTIIQNNSLNLLLIKLSKTYRLASTIGYKLILQIIL